jgi:hypothetical protein
MSTIYGEGTYWRERKTRRNLTRERLLRKARSEAALVGESIDKILMGWHVAPRLRGRAKTNDTAHIWMQVTQGQFCRMCGVPRR